jgi:hypothetical protein
MRDEACGAEEEFEVGGHVLGCPLAFVPYTFACLLLIASDELYQMSSTHLPDEIWTHIGLNLTIEALQALSAVCTLLRSSRPGD